MSLFRVGALLVGASVLFGCSDSTPATSGGTSSGSASGGTPTGGGLTGTWDLVSTRVGRSQGTGVLTISSNGLLVTIDDQTFDYRLDTTPESITWKERSRATDKVEVERDVEAFDTGALPLELGGAWTFVEADEGAGRDCRAKIGTDSNFVCTDAYLPSPFPNPRSGQPYTGKRTSKASSIFGALGGEWELRGESPSDGCELLISGSKVRLKCAGAGSLDGDVTMTFSDDLESVSGTTSEGLELAGTKR